VVGLMLNSFVWEFMLNSWFSNFIIQHENMVRNKKYSVYAQLTLSDEFFFFRMDRGETRGFFWYLLKQGEDDFYSQPQGLLTNNS